MMGGRCFSVNRLGPPLRRRGSSRLSIRPPVEPPTNPVLHELHGENRQDAQQNDCHGRAGRKTGDHQSSDPQGGQAHNHPDPAPHTPGIPRALPTPHDPAPGRGTPPDPRPAGRTGTPAAAGPGRAVAPAVRPRPAAGRWARTLLPGCSRRADRTGHNGPGTRSRPWPAAAALRRCRPTRSSPR